jgi:peroxiredoxin
MYTIRLATLLVSIALLVGPVGAAEPAREAGAGLPVGAAAPDFTLSDQRGERVTLSALLQQGPVAIVFHRSVDWCLYCKLQMVQVQRILPRIEAVGARVVAISYDAVDKLESFAKRTQVTFPLLSDVGSRTIDAYDIRSMDAPKTVNGIARHATFIIDRRGIIRSRLFQLSYQEPAAVDALIDALREAANTTGASHP